jgi:hypothetical protein
MGRLRHNIVYSVYGAGKFSRLLSLLSLSWSCQYAEYMNGMKEILVPLHDMKAVLWCAVNVWCITCCRTSECVAKLVYMLQGMLDG